MRVFQTPGLGGRRLSGKARGQGCCPRMCEKGGRAGHEKGRPETRHRGVWAPEKELEVDLAGEGESLQALEQRCVSVFGVT